MAAPQTTLVPFASLPACATKCGPLYDANGACVPPAVPAGSPESYKSCFCAHSKLQGLKTKPPADICNNNCGAGQDLMNVANWFNQFCGISGGDASSGSGGANNDNSPTTTNRPRPVVHRGWVATHWRWIIMLVVLVVAIVGIWVSACMWRKRYLRRKEMYGVGHHNASGSGTWAPGSGISGATPGHPKATDAAVAEKGISRPSKTRKWLIKEQR